MTNFPPPRFDKTRVHIGALAAGIGAAGSIAGGLIGGSSAAKAAKKAANIAASQAWSDAQLSERAYEDTQVMRDAGTAATQRLAMLLGLGSLPGVQRRYVPQNYNDPFYNETPAPYLGFGGPAGAGAGAPVGGYMPGAEVRPGAGSGGISTQTGEQSRSAVSGGGELTPEMIRDAQAAAMDLFMTDPGYQFRMDEGQKALDRSASARGGLLSGAALKATQRYGEGLAAQEYDNYIKRLFNLGGYAQPATQTAASTGLGYAGLGQQATLAGANARASGYLNQASAINQGITGLGQALGGVDWSALFGGGGFSGGSIGGGLGGLSF